MNRIAVLMGVLLLVALLAPFAGPFVILVLAQVLVLGIMAMSVDLLLGYTGLPSLGQAAYLGVGAYLTAILATKYGIGLGWDFWLVVALGMCVWGLAYRWNSLTGGDNGINMRARPRLGEIAFSNDLVFFYVTLGFFVASFFALRLLVSSPFGRSLVGIRERELRMRILGYNTWLHKYIAFVIAGAFGGLAGVLWAHLNGIVSPADVLLPASVDALLMVVLGGPGTLVGGLIGATVVVFLREYVATIVQWWQYVLGAVYVLTILYLPGGIMGLFKGGKA